MFPMAHCRRRSTLALREFGKRCLSFPQADLRKLSGGRVVLAFLSLVGTAAAFLAWFTETLRSPLGLLAAWTFLVPVAGIAFAAALLNEAPTGWTAIGIALVLASMWVVLHPGPDAVNA